MSKRLLPAVLAFAVLSSGCANYGQERHMAGGAFTPAPALQPNAQRSTIVLMREAPLMSKISYVPWPAMPVAVDGRIVALLPLGSSVALSVPPGRHIITMPRGMGDDVSKLEIVTASGSSDYAEIQHLMGWPSLALVDAKQGREIYPGTSQAKLIYNGVSVDVYRQRLRERSQVDIGAAISAAMPSGETVKSALEAIGAIAFVALEVAVIVAASKQQASYYQPPLRPLQPDPSSAPPAKQNKPLSLPQLGTASLSANNATLAEVIRSPAETRVRDVRTGTTFTIQDGTVRGTDGSTHRLIGNVLYSDTGLSYQIIGDTIFAPDGKSCRRIGSNIFC